MISAAEGFSFLLMNAVSICYCTSQIWGVHFIMFCTAAMMEDMLQRKHSSTRKLKS